MQDIVKKILSVSLCAIYVLASCGFVRHACRYDGVAYVSLLVNNECTLCAEHANEEHQCCKHSAKPTQTEDDEDCCDKVVETISSDQNYSSGNDISAQAFLIINLAVVSDSDLTCQLLLKSIEAQPPLFNYKTPLIYHTAQLRL